MKDRKHSQGLAPSATMSIRNEARLMSLCSRWAIIAQCKSRHFTKATRAAQKSHHHVNLQVHAWAKYRPGTTWDPLRTLIQPVELGELTFTVGMSKNSCITSTFFSVSRVNSRRDQSGGASETSLPWFIYSLLLPPMTWDNKTLYSSAAAAAPLLTF